MIHCFDDDSRKNDADYFYNKGSFAQITDNLNLELKKLRLFASENEADTIGFASGIKVDFGFQDRKRFLIHVFETTVLPDWLRKWRQDTNTQVFGLSQQVADLWEKYNFKTPIVDIGVDTEYWKPDENIKKFDKFTILSTTALNFRSGINYTIDAFCTLWQHDKDIRLIVKNTDERASRVLKIIEALKSKGMDIEYICERMDSHKVKELMQKSHLLAYNPTTSAGLPVLEAASLQLPCIVANCSPTSIYPTVAQVECDLVDIKSQKETLLNWWGLPYTFAGLGLDESKAQIYKLDVLDFAKKVLHIKRNYDIYKDRAKDCRQQVLNRWTWTHSCQQLLKNLNYESA
jgi:glycosyltransferase involved in cell wall biosynthesis